MTPRAPRSPRARVPGGARAVPALAAALVLTACSGTVAGSASPAGGPPPAPGALPTEVLARVDLSPELGLDPSLRGLAADPAGGAYVVADVPGRGFVLVSLDGDGDTLAATGSADLPAVAAVTTLHPRPDGTVAVLGEVLPEGATEAVPGMVVLDPATGEGPVFGFPETISTPEAVLSADGETLYALIAVDGDPGSIDTGEDGGETGEGRPSDTVRRLIAVDLDSGAIRATVDLDVPFGSAGRQLALTPDGEELVAGFTVMTDDNGGQYPLLLRADHDLAAVQEPVRLAESAEGFALTGLAVTDDGTAVAQMSDVDETHVVTLAAGDDRPRELARIPYEHGGLAVDPSGAWAVVRAGEGRLATVDLGSGEVTEPLTVCARGPEVPDLAVLLDGSSVLVFDSCDEEAADQPVVWQVGPG